MPSFIDDRRVGLELYLQELITIPEVWNCESFLKFLDSSQSLLRVQIQMNKLAEKTAVLESSNKMLQQHLLSVEQALQSAISLISEQQNRIARLEYDRRISHDVVTSPTVNITPTQYSNWTDKSAKSDWTEKKIYWNEINQVSKENSIRANDSMGQISSMSNDFIPSSNENVSMERNLLLPIHRSVKSLSQSLLLQNEIAVPSSPQSAGYFVQHILNLENSRLREEDRSFTSPVIIPTKEFVDDTSSEYDWSSIAKCLGSPGLAFSGSLMVSLSSSLGRRETPSMWDRLVDEVVLMIQPQESQLIYR